MIYHLMIRGRGGNPDARFSQEGFATREEAENRLRESLPAFFTQPKNSQEAAERFYVLGFSEVEEARFRFRKLLEDHREAVWPFLVDYLLDRLTCQDCLGLMDLLIAKMHERNPQ